MSLPEAVLMIADEMEKSCEAAEKDGDDYSDHLKVYATQLRVAVKAAGGTQPPQQLPFNPAYMSPMAQHALEIEKARAEFRDKKELKEERFGERMVLAVGGDSDQDSVIIGHDMPVGAFKELDGQVYVLSSEGNLVYSAGQTNKLKKSRQMADNKKVEVKT